MSGSSSGDQTVALRIQAINRQGELRTDIAVAAIDGENPHTFNAEGLTVTSVGRFGLVTLERGMVKSMMLAGGRRLSCAGASMELPGDFHGRVVRVSPTDRTVVIRPDSASLSARPQIGQKVLFRNPGYGYPSVYTLEGIERGDEGLVRLTVNMPLIVARGRIGEVNTKASSFSSSTSVMKMRVVPRLFDGRVVRVDSTSEGYRLASATESAMVLADPSHLKAFSPGGEYSIQDIGEGDDAEVVSQGHRRF